jgi:hypothetical protein
LGNPNLLKLLVTAKHSKVFHSRAVVHSRLAFLSEIAIVNDERADEIESAEAQGT